MLEKKYIKYVLVFFVIVVLEILFFNYSSIYNLINSEHKNIIYEIEDTELSNILFNKDKSIYVTNEFPSIFLKSINKNVNTIDIFINLENFDSNAFIPIYFTESEKDVYSDDKVVLFLYNNAKKRIKLNKKIYSLRFDIGSKSGTNINKFLIVINSTKINISISRIMAMILLFLLYEFLMLIQKKPNYKI